VNSPISGKLRGGLLDGEIFGTLREAQVLVARRRRPCKGEAHGLSVGSRGSLRHRPPAEAATQPWPADPAPLGAPVTAA